MTQGDDFVKKGKCKNKHCSAMSNIAWCDLIKNKIMRLHDYCPHPNCKCQKQTTFTPRHFKMEGDGFKDTTKEKLKSSQKAWNSFLKPTINSRAAIIGIAVGAKSKNAKVGVATTNILKSMRGGKVLSLTDMHGNGFRLEVM